ncbi:MAG: TlpA disulfide reductase family protein [Halioglobus sp.]|nr:TlpA disulfide reductase family protein [Halioglobus sp.]
MRYLCIFAAALSLVGCIKNAPGVTAPSLERLQGQWVAINYWAQWCAPCIKEIPELNRLDQDYASVTVVGVNYDGVSGEELALQRQKVGAAFASLEEDPAAQLGVPRPVVLPTTLILDPTGRLAATLVGPQTLASLVQVTQQELNEGSH